MRSWDVYTVEDQKCFEVLLDTLLSVEAHGVEWTSVCHQRQSVLGIPQVVFGALDSLPRNGATMSSRSPCAFIEHPTLTQRLTDDSTR